MQNGGEKTGEQWLADAPGLTDAVLDAIPHAMIVRGMDYRIIRANRAAEELFRNPLVGCPCFSAKHGRVEPCEDCPSDQVMRTRKPVVREMRSVSGQDMVVSSYPVFGQDGSFSGVVEITQDVTEQKRAERKIRQLLDKVNAQNRELLERQQAMESEMEMAREIQRHLLPQQTLGAGGMRFSFLYRPCGRVGGDIYDVQPLDENRVALIIADAVGHGVPAAFIAVIVHAFFHSSNYDPFSPGDALNRINKELREVLAPGHFATAFYAVFDASSGRLSYARAGHPYPLLLRGGGADPQWLTAGGTVLGGIDNPRIQETIVEIGRGDRLILFTDGLIECVDSAGEPYGVERLKQSAAELAHEDNNHLPRLLLRRAEEFVGAMPFRDDLTIVAAEAAGTGDSPDADDASETDEAF